MDIVNLMEVFIEADLEAISLRHQDSGLLREYIENCEDDYQRQFADHFVRVNDIEVENILEEIANERREIERITELRGDGQGGEQPRNEGEARYQEGDIYNGKEPITYS